MRQIIVLILLASISCVNINSSIIGSYGGRSQGKGVVLRLDSNGIGTLKTRFGMNVYIDTFMWNVDNGTSKLFFFNTDSFKVDLGDSLALITTPKKALYSHNHILYYLDSVFYILYNSKALKKADYGDFGHSVKQLSGEEANTIKQYFGDTVDIINKLK